ELHARWCPDLTANPQQWQCLKNGGTVAGDVQFHIIANFGQGAFGFTVDSFDIWEQTNDHEPWHYHGEGPITPQPTGTPPTDVCSSPPMKYGSWAVYSLNVPLMTFQFHNTGYSVSVNYHYYVPTGNLPGDPNHPPYVPRPGSISLQVQFGNLIVQPNPKIPKILKWDPEIPDFRDTTSAFSLSCAQIKDCDVYESIYPVDRSNSDRSNSEEPVREIHINPLRCPGGGSFNWDGKSKGGWQMEKGLYVFDITAKALSAGNYDSENIRSKYLKILQQTQQTPDGLREKPLIKLYADNPVRGLDQFEILYRLVDTGNIQPKEGKLYLYDPDMNVYEINQFFTLGPNSEMINTLKTTLDTDIDLLLPWGSYPKSGLYTFVLDFLDNHKDYKDHNPRFALPRGKKVIAPPPSVSLRAAYSFDVSAMVDSEAALKAISKAQELWDWRVGYIWQPYPPPGTE
ncbi:MAG: hypothetical protein ACP5KZ_09845, partial [bacterium]